MSQIPPGSPPPNWGSSPQHAGYQQPGGTPPQGGYPTPGPYPPAGGYPPPPPGGYPPGGYGSGPFGYPPGPKRANGPAVASLTFGLLGCTCVPGVAGALATLLGIIGLRKTRDPSVGGKGLAIAGLILGLLGVIAWGSIGGAIYAGYRASGPQRAIAKQFLVDLSAGNTEAAQNASTLSDTEIATLESRVQRYGTLNDTTNIGTFFRYDNGTRTLQLTGIAYYASGPKQYMIVESPKNGAWKVDECVIR